MGSRWTWNKRGENYEREKAPESWRKSSSFWLHAYSNISRERDEESSIRKIVIERCSLNAVPGYSRRMASAVPERIRRWWIVWTLNEEKNPSRERGKERSDWLTFEVEFSSWWQTGNHILNFEIRFCSSDDQKKILDFLLIQMIIVIGIQPLKGLT